MNKIFKDCDICGEEIENLEYERRDDSVVAHRTCILDVCADAFEIEYDGDDISEMFDDMEYDIGDDGE